MAEVVEGRMTAELEGDFVVFRFGMRRNNIRKVRSWLPVFRAATRIMRQLQNGDELGCLVGAYGSVGGRSCWSNTGKALTT